MKVFLCCLILYGCSDSYPVLPTVTFPPPTIKIETVITTTSISINTSTSISGEDVPMPPPNLIPHDEYFPNSTLGA